MQNVTFTFDFKGTVLSWDFCFDMFDRTQNKDWRLRLPPNLNPNTIADLVNLLTILVPRLINVANVAFGSICMIRFLNVARKKPVGFLCMVRQVYTGPVHMASQVHHGQSFLIRGRRTSVRQQVEIRPHTAVSRSKRSF